MSELTAGLRERGANVPHVGNARRFFCRLVKHDRGVKRLEVSWPSKRLASSDQQARALKAETYWAWCERGEALRGSGRYKDALANLDRALELKPDYARAWHARGQTLAECDIWILVSWSAGGYALGTHTRMLPMPRLPHV